MAGVSVECSSIRHKEWQKKKISENRLMNYENLKRYYYMNDLTIYRYAHMVANNELNLSSLPYEIKINVIKKLLDIFMYI